MNALFVCAQCNCVDAVDLAYVGALPADTTAHRCTYCKIGHWHGHFERKPYDPSVDQVCNRPSVR